MRHDVTGRGSVQLLLDVCNGGRRKRISDHAAVRRASRNVVLGNPRRRKYTQQAILSSGQHPVDYGYDAQQVIRSIRTHDVPDDACASSLEMAPDADMRS